MLSAIIIVGKPQDAARIARELRVDIRCLRPGQPAAAHCRLPGPRLGCPVGRNSAAHEPEPPVLGWSARPGPAPTCGPGRAGHTPGASWSRAADGPAAP